MRPLYTDNIIKNEFYRTNNDLSKTGVYKIFHVSKPDLIYVGSASSFGFDRISSNGFYKRFQSHLSALRRKKHHSGYLQNIVIKYGINGLRFEIIAVCDPSETIKLEQYFINTLKPRLNVVKIAGKTTGYKHTKETVRLLSLQRKGRQISETHKLNISLAFKGKMPKNIDLLHSPQSRIKVAEKLKGRPLKECVYESVRKKIYQINIDGCLFAEYKSTWDASLKTGIDRASINKCALGRRKTAGGFIWKYEQAKEMGYSENRLNKRA